MPSLRLDMVVISFIRLMWNQSWLHHVVSIAAIHQERMHLSCCDFLITLFPY